MARRAAEVLSRLAFAGVMVGIVGLAILLRYAEAWLFWSAAGG